MSASVLLLRELQARGIELRPQGDRVAFRPKEKMTPELLEQLRVHRTQLLKMLRDDPRLGLPRVQKLSLSIFELAALTKGACYACANVIFWRLPAGKELICAVCHPPGPDVGGVAWRRRQDVGEVREAEGQHDPAA